MPKKKFEWQWNYDLESEYGPANWSKLSLENAVCQLGQEQSPVNLVGIRNSSQLRPLLFKENPQVLRPVFDGRQLSAIPTQSSHLIYEQQTFTLQRIVIHSPSEHQIQHLNFDAELQFEYLGESEERLHLVVFANEASSADASSFKIGKATGKQNQFSEIVNFRVQDWLPKRLSYIRYQGSLTYPPCSENVIWLLMEDPIAISGSQRQEIAALTNTGRRPLQALHYQVPLRSR